MATYSAITNAQIDPDSPVTTGLATQWRDNPIASHKFVRRIAVGPLVTNSAVLVDDTVLEFAADANTDYAFKVIAHFLMTGGGGKGVQTAIDVPAGTALTAYMTGFGDTAAFTAMDLTDESAYFTTTDDDAGSFRDAGGNANEVTVVIEGMARIAGAAGDVKLRYAQAIAQAATTVQSQVGSFLTYHRVDLIV